jgi:hypothetical protein
MRCGSANVNQISTETENFQDHQRFSFNARHTQTDEKVHTRENSSISTYLHVQYVKNVKIFNRLYRFLYIGFTVLF